MCTRARFGLSLFLYSCLSAAGAEPGSPRPLLVFEPNLGQSREGTLFVARAANYAAHLSAGGKVDYRLPSGGARPPVRMTIPGGRPDAAPAPEMRVPSWTHYYQGSAPFLRGLEIPHYAQVRYAAIYPGIDLVCRGQAGAMELAFELSPGGDLGQIALRFHGVKQARVDREGALLLRGAAGVLRFRPPVAYQPGPDGAGAAVRARYRVTGEEVRFAVSGHDPRRPLVIDPVLDYSSYFGGSGFDAANGIAVDASGNVYITGETASSDFPVPAGGKAGTRRNRDAFVTKINSAGSAVLYTTIVSGSGNDAGKAVAVDAQGQAYVAGVAGGDGFPATQGALRTSPAGGGDGFLARLDSSGKLVFSTYLGASGADYATGVALSSDGSVFVSGYTNSVKFPTTAGAPQSVYAGGGYDAFLLKTSADGKTLLSSTLLGGSDTDLAAAVAADGLGGACLAGYTASRNLAVRNAVQSSPGGGGDALVACLNASGTAWNFVTYLGGASFDQAQGLARGSDGSLYVTGATSSGDFPVSSGAYKPASRGGYDVFVTKLASSGSSILYSALAGGTGSDTGMTIAVDASGRAWTGGYTQSSNFPSLNGWQSGFGGATDGFVFALGSQGTALESSGFLGGAGDDRVLSLALGSSGAVWVTGQTSSTSFPAKGAPVQTMAKASYNAFLSKIMDSGAPPAYPKTVAGDMDGNGHPDLVWENETSRKLTVWYLGGANGTEVLSKSDLATPDMTGWKLAGIADMDKNGKPDMIWQNTGSRRLRYWLMGGARGDTILSSADVQGQEMPGWAVRTAVDMDGNGHADLAWQADSDHQVLVWFMGGADGTQFLSRSWMSTGAMEEWSVAALADMDANGKFDMIWQHDATRILA
ncbi:MAG: SBBP repeat-containing protein, partial [Acidobacteria bacterium]|nr:SBBP repeat-containing protein [Acidobacteriota bacterium]